MNIELYLKLGFKFSRFYVANLRSMLQCLLLLCLSPCLYSAAFLLQLHEDWITKANYCLRIELNLITTRFAALLATYLFDAFEWFLTFHVGVVL